MAWDPLRKRAVLFSGWNGSIYVADTWEWDGQTWQLMNPSQQPPPRDWTQMAFDPISRKVILFGGHDYRRHGTGGPGAFDDMWSWDGNTWSMLQPAVMAPKRFGHVMLTQGNGPVLMLSGGTPGVSYNDQWVWTGTSWAALTPPNLPGARNFAVATWDALRSRAVVYGGVASGTAIDDSWEWDGRDWVRRLSTSGPGVAFSSAIFDPKLGASILVGGAVNGNRSTPTDLIWGYASAKPGSFRAFGQGCRGTAGVPVLNGTPPWIGETQVLTLSPVPNPAVALLPIGRSNTRWGGIPLPLDLGGMGAPGCNLSVEPLLIFAVGGQGGSANLSLAWPADQSLVGLVLHGQGIVIDLPANPSGLVSSNGGTLQIGSK
jgi:hypothetical protein